MTSYPVIWQVGVGGPPPVAGRLDVGPHSLSLHGGRRGSEQRLEISFGELAGVRRTQDRIGVLRAIVIDTVSAGPVTVAAVGASLAYSDILCDLQRIAAAAV
jgi:hypothetical protein